MLADVLGNVETIGRLTFKIQRISAHRIYITLRNYWRNSFKCECYTFRSIPLFRRSFDIHVAGKAEIQNVHCDWRSVQLQRQLLGLEYNVVLVCLCKIIHLFHEHAALVHSTGRRKRRICQHLYSTELMVFQIVVCIKIITFVASIEYYRSTF